MSRNSKGIMILVMSAIILSTIPILMVGINARPHLDDLVFTASSSFRPMDEDPTFYIERSVRFATQNGGAFDVALAVWHTVLDNYMEWQGTFSAIAIFSLHPGVLIAEEAYPLVMLFTMVPLLLSTFFMCRTIWERPLIPFAVLSFISIQWLPSLPNGFFWWNGATYYTTFFSLMLVNIACKIRLALTAGSCTCQ